MDTLRWTHRALCVRSAYRSTWYTYLLFPEKTPSPLPAGTTRPRRSLGQRRVFPDWRHIVCFRPCAKCTLPWDGCSGCRKALSRHVLRPASVRPWHRNTEHNRSVVGLASLPSTSPEPLHAQTDRTFGRAHSCPQGAALPLHGQFLGYASYPGHCATGTRHHTTRTGTSAAQHAYIERLQIQSPPAARLPAALTWSAADESSSPRHRTS
eukprot:scaffold795_cov375-Prasinococcus_capsulatus_cf.AAC.11